MTRTIEDRLRAHYADRTARQALPGPEADVAVRAALGSADGDGGRGGDGGDGDTRVIRLSGRSRPHRRPRVLVAVAAACAAAAGVAGALVLGGGDDGANVTTDRRPATTTVPDRRPEDPDPSPTVGDTTPDTTPDTTTTTEPPPSGTAPTGPIVSVEGVLGTWTGTEWVRWEPGPTPPTGDEYQVVRLGDPITTAVGREGVDCTPEGLPSIDVGLAYTDDRLAPSPIAVAGVADPRPRPVEELDPASAVYRDAAAGVVAELGLTDPAPQVRQVVRGDLDGDGSAEVLVVAERISDPVGWEAAEGDYAVVFLRHLVGGELTTSVVASSIPHPEPGMTPSAEVYRVGALADLNGDGRMEIVLDGDYYEGSWTAVHELRTDGGVPEVLSATCGV